MNYYLHDFEIFQCSFKFSSHRQPAWSLERALLVAETGETASALQIAATIHKMIWSPASFIKYFLQYVQGLMAYNWFVWVVLFSKCLPAGGKEASLLWKKLEMFRNHVDGLKCDFPPFPPIAKPPKKCWRPRSISSLCCCCFSLGGNWKASGTEKCDSAP